MKLLLIRHGQSVANAEGRVQGQFDSPLNDRGRDQARALARRLRREAGKLSIIYASDLSRALETAQILAAELDAHLVLDARLREYDAGVLNGIIWRDIEHLYPDIWHAIHHSPNRVPIPREEGVEVFHARLVATLDDVRAEHRNEETVALVAHGASLGMILVHLLGMDMHRPIPFRFDNASLSIVDFTLRGPRLTILNDTCHLENDLR